MTKRRTFLKQTALAGIGVSILGNNLSKAESFLNILQQKAEKFVLPMLPYAYDALEPHIDKMTMEIHHTKHHQAYVDKLNKALEEAKISGLSIEDICKNVSKYPAAVRNNGGGHWNHSLFWGLMKAPGEAIAKNNLTDAIQSAFGSFEDFKTKFSEAAKNRFGSGWSWLVVNKDKKLEIGSTPNQDNPLMDLSDFKGVPILGLDVWEHAYYLKYQNKRADYISAWWNVVNWEEAGRRYDKAMK